MNGIAWSVVNRMMIDAPSYDMDVDADNEVIALTDSNSDDIMNYVNNLI